MYFFASAAPQRPTCSYHANPAGSPVRKAMSLQVGGMPDLNPGLQILQPGALPLSHHIPQGAPCAFQLWSSPPMCPWMMDSGPSWAKCLWIMGFAQSWAKCPWMMDSGPSWAQCPWQSVSEWSILPRAGQSVPEWWILPWAGQSVPEWLILPQAGVSFTAEQTFCSISLWIFGKKWNCPRVPLGEPGGAFWWKNQHSKISWHCPFKQWKISNSAHDNLVTLFLYG